MFGKCCVSDSNYCILYHQAAAYYYHGLILDKGNEPSFHVSAVCCFLAAEQLLSESKKACLSFSLAAPVTRLGLISSTCSARISRYPWKNFFLFLCSILFCFFFGKGSSTMGIYEAFTSENSWSCIKEVSDVWLPLRTREVSVFLCNPPLLSKFIWFPPRDTLFPKRWILRFYTK